MIINIIIVSIVGGLLCLDRVVVQAMISRPIVAAPVIGLILSDPYTGLIAGAFVELLWIDRGPIGAYIPPNETMAAILITAATILSGQKLGLLQLPSELIALSVLLFLPMGIFGQKMDRWVTRGNEKLARGALIDAKRGDTRAIERRHLIAIFKNWLVPTILILLVLPVGIAVLTWAFPKLPAWTVRGLTLSYALIPFVGIAVALSTVSIRGAIPIVCAVFLMTSIVIVLIRGV